MYASTSPGSVADWFGASPSQGEMSVQLTFRLATPGQLAATSSDTVDQRAALSPQFVIVWIVALACPTCSLIDPSPET